MSKRENEDNVVPGCRRTYIVSRSTRWRPLGRTLNSTPSRLISFIEGVRLPAFRQNYLHERTIRDLDSPVYDIPFGWVERSVEYGNCFENGFGVTRGCETNKRRSTCLHHCTSATWTQDCKGRVSPESPNISKQKRM